MQKKLLIEEKYSTLSSVAVATNTPDGPARKADINRGNQEGERY